MLKEKRQGDHKEALLKLILEFEERFQKRSQNLDNLGYISQLPQRLKTREIY